MKRGKKLFLSRDRLVQHYYKVRVVVRVMDSFWVIVTVRIRVGIRVYVKPFFRLQNHKNQSHVTIFGRAN